MNTNNKQLKNRTIASLGIILASLGLAYAPIPGLEQKIVVVSGTELAEPIQQLKDKFEQENPNIKVELKSQGSQDIVNNYVDKKNDFQPTIIIPASAEFIEDLNQRLSIQNNGQAFYDSPQPIAKTFLVGIAWPERGKVLFPDNRFSWQRLEQAMTAGNWQGIGGKNEWGSFDFVTTDPTRSNSGQATLNLWSIAKTGGNLNLNDPSVATLFSTIKRSVYQPPRSTDILLQEFIARGPNDADVATVYESIALSRWQQSQKNQNKAYQIYYLNPTIETVATAAIVRQNVNDSQANAARKFITFLTQPEQQKVFVQFGFRPVNNSVNLQSIPNSPWSQNIPGVELNPSIKTIPAPNPQTSGEIQRLWQRVQ